jgi:hypothetical protein
MLLRRSTLALGLLLAFGPQAGFAQNAAQKVLLEQALYWKSKGNGARAAEARVTRLRPRPNLAEAHRPVPPLRRAHISVISFSP